MSADEQLAELLKTQKSLTEWLHDINHKDVDILRHEDNEKRERLKVLNRAIDLPFDEPVQFEAAALENQTPAFTKYLEENGDELCALRLIPKKQGLPKLRMRGKTVRGAYAWFKEQAINSNDYRADFIPHPPDNLWATIFVVNQHGIQGEIIFGGHHQLTQGFHQTATPHIFRYDFKDWMIYPSEPKALEHLKKVAEYLQVTDKNIQSKLTKELSASFAHDYLEGYFETSDSSLGTWFIDYSPTLGKLYADMVVKAPEETKAHQLSGQIGCSGTATGTVKIVRPDQLDEEFPTGAVLVCAVTTPDYVPLMQKASAIVTDQGGILSHAAIVARELKIPCIVGTENATTRLIDGQTVTVNADNGTISY
jgi:phosphohistidine swiveling domain-containing protein